MYEWSPGSLIFTANAVRLSSQSWTSWTSWTVLLIVGESSWRTFNVCPWKASVSPHIFFFFIVYPFQLVFIDLEQIHPPVTSSHAASDLTSCCETTLSFLLLSCFSKRPCHTLGVQQPDEEEMKSMASTPHRSHVYSVSTYSEMNTVQRELISQVCAGVDDQLNFLASRGEGEMKHAAQT